MNGFIHLLKFFDNRNGLNPTIQLQSKNQWRTCRFQIASSLIQHYHHIFHYPSAMHLVELIPILGSSHQTLAHNLFRAVEVDHCDDFNIRSELTVSPEPLNSYMFKKNVEIVHIAREAVDDKLKLIHAKISQRTLLLFALWMACIIRPRVISPGTMAPLPAEMRLIPKRKRPIISLIMAPYFEDESLHSARSKSPAERWM